MQLKFKIVDDRVAVICTVCLQPIFARSTRATWTVGMLRTQATVHNQERHPK